MHRRIIKNFLDVLVLAELRNGSMSGYDVIAFIHNKFRLLVSSGTVYSLLYSLERDELIAGSWNQRKRVYKLTEKGEETIKAILNANDKIKLLMSSLLQVPK
jgi:DNA-binding PadR family transcriptional regulator